jgi:Uma2 family endonuclease
MAVLTEPRVHQWTRSEYYTMAAAGLFDGKHVELIEGQVIEMSPMGSPHRTAVILAGDALRQAFGAGYFVQAQVPLALGELSDPEPDLAVIAGAVRDYTEAHPTTAVLIVEVADTSLTYDRTTKASLYAKAGLADYWIVNLVDRQLEVHRHPMANPASPFGFGYAEVTILTAADLVTPVAATPAVIPVADLLP